MIFAHVRRTKLIWSFESGCLNDSLIKDITTAEFDALRLVYDEGSGKKIQTFLTSLQKELAAKNRNISVMIDVATRVRAFVGGISDPEELNFGDVLRLTPVDGGGDLEIITEHWASLFAKDELIYFGYGSVVLKAISKNDKLVEAEVVQGGTVFPHMDVYVPATRPELSLKDVQTAELMDILKVGVDFLVVPGFVKEAEINNLKASCEAQNISLPWLILKLNSSKIHNKLAESLAHVHGVFISRLDMAFSIEPAMIPMITKEVIQLCNDKAKLVFTASQMLGSMRHNVTPTRAEVSDIANAVTDGTDAVVLSEDVAYGSYATKAIQIMRRIVEDVEEKDATSLNWLRHDPGIENEMDAVAYTAYKTANRVKAKAIVCLTKEGNTAIKLASFRSKNPVIAVTFSKQVLKKLSLVRGVDGILLETDPVIDQVLPVVNKLLTQDSWLKAGDKIVFVTVTLSPLGKQASNLFTIQTLS